MPSRLRRRQPRQPARGRNNIDSATATEERRTIPVAAGASGTLAPTSASPCVEKSVLAFSELNRIRNKEHLGYVGAQPCLLCSATPSDTHDVRFAQPRAMSRKLEDDFTVPLCRKTIGTSTIAATK